MILFIDGCVRSQSRTRALAQAVLSCLDGPVTRIALYSDGPAGLNEETLTQRDALVRQKRLTDPLLSWANQFAQADTILLAAPYWDLLFPARVRDYLESVTVSGVTFCYGPTGRPQGLCRAKRLLYVSTAGGPVFRHFGFDYVKALAENFYGIEDVRLIQAEGLDIWGADPDRILEQAKQQLPALLGLNSQNTTRE